MPRKTILIALTVGIAFSLMSVEAFAKTTTTLISQEMIDGSEEVKKSIFDYAMWLVATLGLAMAIFVAIMGNTKQLFVFIGVIVASFLLPKFVDAVFSMLIP